MHAMQLKLLPASSYIIHQSAALPVNAFTLNQLQLQPIIFMHHC